MGITLTEEHFRDLVAGREITLRLTMTAGNSVEIDVPVILADIGWDRMIKALVDAGPCDWPATFDDAVARFRQGEERPQ